MPRLSGFEATRQIRINEKEQSSPRTVIVAMTANALETDQQMCVEAGMDDYLQKPVQMSALQAILTNWGHKIYGAAPTADESPIDLTRLLNLVDYNEESSGRTWSECVWQDDRIAGEIKGGDCHREKRRREKHRPQLHRLEQHVRHEGDCVDLPQIGGSR